MQLKNATVLVVDDEPMLCDIFGEWLEREGCRVLTAENGAAALRVVAAEKADVIVSDIRMPVMGGVALAKNLHSLEKEVKQYTPKIIFITGFGDLELCEAYDLGVESMLNKPIDRNTFIATVGRALQSREETWSQPVAEAGIPLRMILPPVFIAIEQGAVDFGRGGFCLRADLPARLGPVRFELTFESEALALKGHGQIQWVDPLKSLVGIEILNLDDECRAWAVRLIEGIALTSYIPAAMRSRDQTVRARASL